MGKKRNLNGLPNTLEQRFFSTNFFWDKAYMSDWIWNAANEKGIRDIEIDILNQSVRPKQLEIKPIIGHLPRLVETIESTLESNEFKSDFIIEATFKISIFRSPRLLTCQAVVKDKDGRVYEGNVYTEQVYEAPFKVYPRSIVDKIMGLLRK